MAKVRFCRSDVGETSPESQQAGHCRMQLCAAENRLTLLGTRSPISICYLVPSLSRRCLWSPGSVLGAGVQPWVTAVALELSLVGQRDQAGGELTWA